MHTLPHPNASSMLTRTAAPRRVCTKAMLQAEKSPSAEKRKPRLENKPGNYFVDHTCIDCDTCRWMDPLTFGRANGQSAVVRQPETEEERVQALRALMSCPTFSIHAPDTATETRRAALQELPRAWPGAPSCYHCGFASVDSFGAAAWLIVRDGGNVLVDSPRFDPKLRKNIEALGGAKYIFLTHRDDVADHAKWASALGAQRIIHRTETNQKQGTDECEVQLDGDGPWRLPDGGDDVTLVNTPGHTQHHVVLFYAPERALFSGDHLAFRDADRWGAVHDAHPDDGKLGITREYCWYDADVQVESMRALADLDWVHVLPGHGRPGSLADAGERRRELNRLLAREGHAEL